MPEEGLTPINTTELMNTSAPIEDYIRIYNQRHENEIIVPNVLAESVMVGSDINEFNEDIDIKFDQKPKKKKLTQKEKLNKLDKFINKRGKVKKTKKDKFAKTEGELTMAEKDGVPEMDFFFK